MKRKMIIKTAAFIIAAVALTGCGQRIADKPTEAETQTEKKTEAVTEAVTEAAVIVVTEAPTETEVVTEVQTEPQTQAPLNLTAEEEQAQEQSYDTAVTYYAADNVNIRETPSTENQDNIFASYDQGEAVAVSGETPTWYVVYVGETKGYVKKDNFSQSEVAPKSEDEMAAEASQQGEETAAAETTVDTAVEEAPAADTSVAAADSSYADGFSVTLAGDANLRVDAGETADVIAVVPNGTSVTAIGETGNWYQVSYNGQTGYINKNLVG